MVFRIKINIVAFITKATLAAHIQSIDTTCLLCHSQEETTIHIFTSMLPDPISMVIFPLANPHRLNPTFIPN